MPRAAPDEVLCQSGRFLRDNSPSSQDLFHVAQGQESGGKANRKGKNGSKGRTKGVKLVAKTTDEPLSQPSPSQSEPFSCPDTTSHPVTTHIVSPVLEALGSLATTQETDTAFRTGAWAKSIPFGKSPPNDITDGCLVGESPFSCPTNAERGGFNHLSPSASPPLERTRPLSYGNGYLSFAPSRHQSSDRQQRHSMNGQLQSQPPLPHLPQAHFYGAPEVDLPSLSGQHWSSMEGSYSFYGFDTILSPALKATRIGGKVLLVGTDGGLDVLAFEDRKTRSIGKLAGLNGRVLDAKLLPWTSSVDPFASSRPHVSIVIHGLISSKEDGAGSSSGSEPSEILPGLPARPVPHEKQPNKEETVFYQTRVEIYSLRTGEQITTLFTSRPIPCLESFRGLSVLAPAPVGNLKLYASDKYVIVASGVSGEVYIYGVASSSTLKSYQCLAKTWTSVQLRESRRYSTSSSSTDQDGSQIDVPNSSASDNPIISLGGRWLAVVPPANSHRSPPLGSVPTSLILRKFYGLDTQIPPARPLVTCLTDSGEGESLLDKVARGVTQELFRGARWMGDHGLQAWNHYWNKDQHASQTGGLRRPPQLTDTLQPAHSIFPPTHAQDLQGASSSEPDLVSVIDLKRLEEGSDTKPSSPSPMTTFQAPNGCSFLSFSPNGLMLMTASRKGDIQYVWDLAQIKYCRAGVFLSDDLASSIYCTTTSHVRQVARYARLTTSSIADVIWTAPTGERLAIVTRKGTVHVFDIPRSAFQWPPLRRARPNRDTAQVEALRPSEMSEATMVANPFTVAMKLVGDTTQPILAAVRGRAPSVGPAFPSVSGFGITSAAGVRSGKAVAVGLSKSVGAATGTVNTLRHVGENRLHVARFAKDPVFLRVTWFCYQEDCLLGVIDNGIFKLYKIRRSATNQKARRNQPVIGGKELEFKLPLIMQSPCGPLQLGIFSDPVVKATWALPSTHPHTSASAKLKSQPLSQAEIETNAPYQPFHTDQRVSLHLFTSDTSHLAMSPPSSQWAFGNEIPIYKLHVRPPNQSDDEDPAQGNSSGPAEMENHISLGSGAGQVEEVVITTRRKKKHMDNLTRTSPGIDEDDGFFEDDCDVLDFARDRV